MSKGKIQTFSFRCFQQTHEKFKLTKTLKKSIKKLIKPVQIKQQKQPLSGVLQNGCSEICGQKSWKIPMNKLIFGKVEGLESATLLKLNFFIGILKGFYLGEFYLATFRTGTFNNICFSRTLSPLLKHQLLKHDCMQIWLLYDESIIKFRSIKKAPLIVILIRLGFGY